MSSICFFSVSIPFPFLLSSAVVFLKWYGLGSRTRFRRIVLKLGEKQFHSSCVVS